jgi:6-phosphofructokinase 1
MVPLPFEDMINPENRKLKTRKVDVDGESYECARRYMIRLERKDFADAGQLGKLATTCSQTPEQFRGRFGYLVEKEP